MRDLHRAWSRVLRVLGWLLILPFYPFLWIGRIIDGEHIINEHLFYLLIWLVSAWILLVKTGVLSAP